jgi:hypothetical protein
MEPKYSGLEEMYEIRVHNLLNYYLELRWFDFYKKREVLRRIRRYKQAIAELYD